jgi:hypothetical protein
MPEYTKPLPEITAESKPFWDACARHQLLVQTCRACGAVQYYPRCLCRLLESRRRLDAERRPRPCLHVHRDPPHTGARLP